MKTSLSSLFMNRSSQKPSDLSCNPLEGPDPEVGNSSSKVVDIKQIKLTKSSSAATTGKLLLASYLVSYQSQHKSSGILNTLTCNNRPIVKDLNTVDMSENIQSSIFQLPGSPMAHTLPSLDLCMCVKTKATCKGM